MSLLQTLPSPWAHIQCVRQLRLPFQPCQFLMTVCHDEMLVISKGFVKLNNTLKELPNLGWTSYFQRHSGSTSHCAACIFICTVGCASARLQDGGNLTTLHFHFYICEKSAYRIYSGDFYAVNYIQFLPQPLWPPVMQVWVRNFAQEKVYVIYSLKPWCKSDPWNELG